MENRRIENFELRKNHNIFTDRDYYEIVRWYPNSFYGKKDLYKYKGDGFYSKDEFSIYKIHESIFKNPESCLSIAFFKEDRKEECYDFISIGDRLHELTVDEWIILKQLIDYFYETINQ